MFLYPALQIGGDSGIKCLIAALENIEAIFSHLLSFSFLRPGFQHQALNFQAFLGFRRMRFSVPANPGRSFGHMNI